MIRRILLAGILGGLVVIVWESVAHMALPPGEAGVKALRDEPGMLSAFKNNFAGGLLVAAIALRTVKA